MRSPSTMGVGLAGEFLSCITCAGFSADAKTSVFHKILPVAASRHSARSDGALRASPDSPAVRKICPRLMTGEDHPNPGTTSVHFTFFTFDHSTGNFVVVE